MGTLDEPLNVLVAAVTFQNWCGNQNEEEGGQKDTDRSGESPPEAGDQVPHERRGDDHRSRADHADGNRDQKFALSMPSMPLHHGLLQARYDNQPAYKSHRACFEKAQQELDYDTELCDGHDGTRYKEGHSLRLATP